jgi:hypothetical protein
LVRIRGGSGRTQPSSNALSMMAHSMVLMATGGSEAYGDRTFDRFVLGKIQ